jgi:hypothetical protein
VIITPLTKEMTYHETLDPAMQITDQTEADQYFEALVVRLMTFFEKTRKEAESITKTNLGYYAGYYNAETRERVERLFHCEHPYFGKIAEKGPPSADEAFNIGRKLGEEMKEKANDGRKGR